MHVIELQQVLPEVFAGNDRITSDVWHRQLAFQKGQKYLVEAASGTGKSSLCSFIYGYRKDYQGILSFDGENIRNISVARWVEIRKRSLSMLFQELRLFEELTAWENVQLKNSLTGYRKRSEIRQWFEELGIADKWDRKVGQMSFGQQQRVAIARAIVNEPEVLLLDEPLAALDLKMRKDMQMELKEMHRRLGITFVYVTHDQEEALTLSDTIVVMSEGKIQQIGTPTDIYNEPINSFVADFIGESNILNGTMVRDCLVRFCGQEFECVDKGFGENAPVDVVIRPEDLYIFPVSDAAQLRGIVQSCIFKGVHYEMAVAVGDYEFLVQDYHAFEAGSEVGLLIKPMDIHIMQKERVCNTFEASMVDETHVEFLGCEFECSRVDMSDSSRDWKNVKVEVDFDKVILQDNEEDGMLTGEVKFILYKGNHYHLTVFSDWDENVFVDTNDVWDDGDRVGITIPAEAIRVIC